MGKRDDWIEQNLRRGDRGSRSEREPTRTCTHCSGGKVSVLRSAGVNAKGKPVYRSVTEDCSNCDGKGVR